MTEVYLGLGANAGDRRLNLARAIGCLRRDGIEVVRVSPVVETRALLTSDAPRSWDRAYLNLVVEARAEGEPGQCLETVKAIERELGREPSPRWAPRPIDIDILLWGERVVSEPGLTIPHPAMHERAFVLVPLAHLASGLVLPGGGTVLAHRRRLGEGLPLWMGILNLTPDSFSDGGRLPDDDSAIAAMEAMRADGAHIVDLGAESTRPGARPVDPEDEWRRLEAPLRYAAEAWGRDPLAPRVSVDTRHPKVAERALALGAAMINDVTGLTDPAMVSLARDADAQWVAMHHTSIPADPAQVLPPGTDPVATVRAWLEARLEEWAGAGIDPDRVIVDPGVGFGKTAAQSWALLHAAEAFLDLGARVLVGHSRKSFLEAITGAGAGDRAPETLAVSLALAEKGIDVLRVHDVADHARAHRAWSRMGPSPRGQPGGPGAVPTPP